MAKVYICDRCGHEERFSDGIAGNEFDYYGPRHRNPFLHKRRGFETLTKTWRKLGWVDVCRPCFDEIVSAKQSAERGQRALVFEAVKSAVVG